MKYQYLGNNIKVSKISFGTWGLGSGSTWSDRKVNLHQTEELLDEAYDLGINYIDTAPVYGIGYSEELLGRALKTRRDRFVIQTKCSLNWRNEGGVFEYERDGKTVNRDHRPSAVRKDVEDSLCRLQIDTIDALVVHRMSKDIPIEETAAELEKMRQEGKIRTVVLSNSQPEHLIMYRNYTDVTAVQEKFSLLSQENRRYFDVCEKTNTVFQVYGSLEEGALTGQRYFERSFHQADIRTKSGWQLEPHRTEILRMFASLESLIEKYHCSVANLMQAWTLCQYRNINLLTGFRRMETLRDTCKVLDIHLLPEDVVFIGCLAAALTPNNIHTVSK